MQITWQTKKLGEVCEFTRGLTYSKSDEVLFSNNAVFRANNVNYLSNVLDLSEIRYIKDSFEIPENKKVKKDSLLICTASGSKEHLGKVALIDKDYNFAFGGFMGQITPKNGVESKYLYYFFVSAYYKEYILKLTGGTNINNLKFSDIENIEIPLPPPSEQRRIVKILDEAFEKLEKAKENTEKNLQNSKELFESYLNNIFSNPRKDWEEKKIGDVLDTGAGGTPLKMHKDYYEGGDIPWLRSGEVCQKDIFKSELYITEKGLKNSSARLFPTNTVLVAMYGATAGQTGILRFESTTNQAVCGILPNEKFIPEYVYYFFLYEYEHLVSQAVGGAQPNISQIKIKNTLIPILSVLEQKEIVKKLDQLSEKTQKLESLYRQKLESIEELKKSILSKAFSKGL